MTLIATILAALTASAIATTDATPHERRILLRIAELESGGWRADVANCTVRGKLGELSVFQILPRDRAEYVAACATFEGAARIALARLRESRAACPGAVGAEQLAVYVSGKCGRGMVEARARWVP